MDKGTEFFHKRQAKRFGKDVIVTKRVKNYDKFNKKKVKCSRDISIYKKKNEKRQKKLLRKQIFN